MTSFPGRRLTGGSAPTPGESDALGHLVRAVERLGASLSGSAPLIVACSGGADSLALVAATCAWRDRRKLRSRPGPESVVAVVVDHQLQDDSAHTAEVAARQCQRLGVDEALVVRVNVDTESGVGGLEAAARRARYRALADEAARRGTVSVLLGHTLDDQAETVLLGLTRGSGARSLQGMKEKDGLWWRPFLAVRRIQTEQVCADLGVEPHHDPHNVDERFTRVRIRRTIMPAIAAELGDGAVRALARTARSLQADQAALEEWAGREYGQRQQVLDGASRPPTDRQVQAPALSLRHPVDWDDTPAAVRRRILRLWVADAGCPMGQLSAIHLLDLDRLGQRCIRGPLRLPGDREASRREDELLICQAIPLHSPRLAP